MALAGDLPPLAVEGVAVRVIGRRAEDADMAVLLEPAHLPVIRNVAPDEIAAGAVIGRAFRPAEAGGDALDRGIADLVLEALVEHLDAVVGIPRIGKIAQ